MKIYYLTIYDLQTCHQNFLDVLFCQGCVGILQTFVDSDVVRHLVDAAVVDTNLTQMHGDVDALEETVGGVDGKSVNKLLIEYGNF